MTAALNDLKRDGYERVYALMVRVRDMPPGAAIVFDLSERKCLRIAHGCSYDTQRLIGPLLGYGTISRA
jgi:hypothetical protein